MEAQTSKCGYLNLLQMSGDTTREELLTEIGSFAETQGLANDGLVGALLEREENYPTGISAAMGVAIPHADPKYTHKASMIVATLAKPVMFRPMGGGDADVPVDIIFMLLMKDTKKHLDLLGTIVKFIQNKEKIESLKSDQAIQILSDSFDSFFESYSGNCS